MARRIDLRTAVPVSCHMVYARVSLAERIPYLLPVLAHIQDQKPGATVQSLSGDLFPGLDPLSRKLLDMCRDNGLAEHDGARYTLTEDGASAVQEGVVFADEEAIWKIHHTLHPLVRPEYRVLKLERATQREAGYNRGDSMAYLGSSIEGLRDATMACSFGENTRFRIRDMDPYAKRSGSDMRVTMRWRIDEDGSSIEVSDGSAKRHLPPPADMTYGKAWGQLLENARIDGWDYGRDRLNVSYYKLDNAEKASMKRTLEFDPEIEGAEFDRLTKVVYIYPESEHDAQLWARDMLAGRISEYATIERYQRLADDIREKFPDFDVSLGGRADHIPDDRSPLFWRIQAMEDWDL